MPRPWSISCAQVDCDDLNVEAGELVGMIGPNGSGKTTLMRLALGYLKPTSGTIRVLGRDAGAPEARSDIGWVPDEPIYPKGATARRLLELWLSGHGWARSSRRKRIDELVERFGIVHAADRSISTYSLGMQQKTSLMLAVSHKPKLLILDEPFSALDHRSLLRVRRSLADFCDAGGAIFVSSHHLAELESMCNRAVFLANGKIQREERLEQGGATRIHIELGNPERARQVLASGCPDWVEEWDIRDPELLGRLRHRDHLANLIEFLVAHKVRIHSATESTSRLEEVFMKLERVE